YELNHSFLKTIDEGDIHRLVELQTSQTPSFLMENINEYLDEKYAGDFQMKEFERVTIFQQMDALGELDNVNSHIYNNKSAFQQLHSFFTGFGPLIILFLTVFVASEILTDDRKHRTIKAGQPVGFRKYIFYQSVTGFFDYDGGDRCFNYFIHIGDGAAVRFRSAISGCHAVCVPGWIPRRGNELL